MWAEKTNASEPPMRCRKRRDVTETRLQSLVSVIEPRRGLLTALMMTGVKVARARFRLSRGTWEPVVTMPREMSKWKSHEGKSPDAWHRGGSTRSSDETR